MRICLDCVYHTAKGVIQPGECIDVSTEEGKRLLALGVASEVAGEAPRKRAASKTAGGNASAANTDPDGHDGTDLLDDESHQDNPA